FGLAWISPYVGIYLTDLALRRNRFDPPSLFASTAGIYHRRGGINVPALVAQVIGTTGAMLWLDAYPAYVGPIANALGGTYGSDLDIFFGGGIAAVIYGVLAFRQVRSEGMAAEDHPTAFAGYGSPPPPSPPTDVDHRPPPVVAVALPGCGRRAHSRGGQQ
ncbi:MAG: hypothetical protein ACYDEN_06535, partial [Acidimicrobiales bacterium]